ncbi:FAD-dependent monooxygenase [Staphylococcus simulans]
MKIAIVGGGIGGLTAAALLHEQDHEVHVFEQQEEIKEVGAGIGIGGNVLEKLGNHYMAKGIKNAGQVIKEMEILDDKGHTLNKAVMKKGTVNLTLARQTLIEIIASYVPDSVIHTGTKIINLVQNSSKVTLTTEQGEAHHFDLCIAADGLHSIIRQQVNPKAKVNYQGYTCFRGLVEDISLTQQHTAKEYWGAKGRVGIVPLLNNKAYWFIAVNAKQGDPKFKDFTKPYIQAYYNHYPNEVRRILDQQSETGIIRHDIYDLTPMQSFVYGRTLLLGDAAHATTPNMGQGAGQAMEDAIVLTNCLSKYDFREALSRYDALRVKHTGKVIKRSRSIGKKAQYQNGLMIGLRNFVLKRIPSKLISNQAKFLYKTKAE